MTKIADLSTFDIAEHLKTKDDVAAYLSLVLEVNEPAELAHALGVICPFSWHDRHCHIQWYDPLGALQGIALR